MNENSDNPKDLVGQKKFSFSCVPSPVLAELSLAMTEGARKYGKYNWRNKGVRASIYYDACQRHLMAWHEGQDIDPDSGVHHLTKAMACLVVIRDSQMYGNAIDDRPPSYPDNWQKELNDKAAKLIEQYPNPKSAFTKES